MVYHLVPKSYEVWKILKKNRNKTDMITDMIDLTFITVNLNMCMCEVKQLILTMINEQNMMKHRLA